MRHHKKERKIKEMLKDNRECSEACKSLYRPKYEKLDKQIFAGHWRFFVVRADVLRSSVGQEIQQVVDLCNSWVLGHKKDPSSYDRKSWSAKVIGYDENQQAVIEHVAEQLLRPIDEKRWKELNLSDKIKQYFVQVTQTFYNKTYIRYFPNVPSHMIEFGFKRAYITAVPVEDSEARSKRTLITNKQQREDADRKLGKSHRDDWDLNLSKKRKLNSLITKEIGDELV